MGKKALIVSFYTVLDIVFDIRDSNAAFILVTTTVMSLMRLK